MRTVPSRANKTEREETPKQQCQLKDINCGSDLSANRLSPWLARVAETAVQVKNARESADTKSEWRELFKRPFETLSLPPISNKACGWESERASPASTQWSTRRRHRRRRRRDHRKGLPEWCCRWWR
ncbi:hypothetical protein L596_001688 [Steinernema carpocapsae]|uniref:Uncharacterized protein n=1 Tax=Steinernema carpocapsae TaxID=34508 RepID=A0A4V6I764_STECR|nr:hypothetical protein L596_001688 [Steinernema carpocapsae]